MSSINVVMIFCICISFFYGILHLVIQTTWASQHSSLNLKEDTELWKIAELLSKIYNTMKGSINIMQSSHLEVNQT